MPNTRIIVENNTLVATDIGSSKFLQERPRGAYTTCRTFGFSRVLLLDHHIRRMINSFASIAPDCRMELNQEQFKEHALHYMRVAVLEYLRRVPSLATYVDHPSALGDEALRHVRLVMEGQLSRDEPTAYPEFHFTFLVTPTQEKTAHLALHVQPNYHPPLSFRLHPSRPPPDATEKDRLAAEVRNGFARPHAVAKDTQWVEQRHALELALGPYSEESLLRDPARPTALLEGLSSNLFVVYRGGTLRTAGEGVLLGSIRELTLRVAEELKIPVEFTPPDLAERDQWSEVLITSTSRLVMLADEVVIHPLEGPDAPEVLRLNGESSEDAQSVGERLRSGVLERLLESSDAYIA
eukprot:gnl/Trimastix_PCT/3348.p1 GENE.gnl/Trimastix_PCT/3348~~gnl/Trimastix_PCT/3348.p1  ORF type:complete len:352 (-),score=102.09 gnl/Trimastix_PCT/3348:39-1094(-)